MASDWAIKAATEALIGMQHDCEAMQKLTKVEQDSLLHSVASALREAYDKGLRDALEAKQSKQVCPCSNGDCVDCHARRDREAAPNQVCPGCGYPWSEHVFGEQGSSVCAPKHAPQEGTENG